LKWTTFLLLVPFLGLSGLLIILPFAAVVVKSLTTINDISFLLIKSPLQLLSTQFSPQNFVRIFSDSYYRRTLYNTLIVATFATVLCVGIGIFPAYFYAKMTKHQGKIGIITTLPLLAPDLLSCFALWMFLGADGPVNTIFYNTLHIFVQPIDVIGTWQMLVLADFYVLGAYFIQSLGNILKSSDPSIEEASLSLGATPFQTFRKILLPMNASAIVILSLFVFTRTMAEFVTALILGGGKTPVLPLLVYLQLTTYGRGGDLCVASAISVVLVLLTLSTQTAYGYIVKVITRGRG